jgi:uncharacterized iron-regulated protein
MKHFVLALMLAAAPVAAEQIDADRLDSLPAADVIWLGEVHDHPLHHIHQARSVTAIAPRALVLEMLTQAQVDATPQARSEVALRDAWDWDASGWPDFAMYWPVINAAADVALYAAALPREEARAAYGADPAAVFGPDAARFGLNQPFGPDVQAAQIALQDDAHCNAMPAEMLPAMVDIQRLRDARLAQAALRALEETGGPVVVIAGTGHLGRDIAAPAMLAQAAPDLRQIVVGQFESDPGAPPMDYWIVTDPHPRPDPCAAFR